MAKTVLFFFLGKRQFKTQPGVITQSFSFLVMGYNEDRIELTACLFCAESLDRFTRESHPLSLDIIVILTFHKCSCKNIQ